MNDQRLIITSKDGNMYSTDIESLMKIREDNIVMKPAAYEENDNPHYEMLDENPHFKNIYFTKLIGETFIAIGMDRLVSFWNVNSYRVQYDFNIKCLGSKVTQVTTSPLEPQTFLMACNDHTMRLWNTGKKANRFITTILWKGLDKKKVRAIEFHPVEESIICITTETELSLMDVHAHTMVSEFQIRELYDGIQLFGRWMHRKVVEKIISSKFESNIKTLINKNKGYRSFLKNINPYSNGINSKFRKLNKKYQKEINPDYIYVSYVQNKGFVFADFKLGAVFCVNYNMEKFVSNLEVVDLMQEENVMIVFFGDKKGNMIVVKSVNNKFSHIYLFQIHTALITAIKANTKDQPKGTMLLATGSYDRSIKITKFKDYDSKTMKKTQFETLFLFKQ